MLANESSAVQSLRKISTAEIVYSSTYGHILRSSIKVGVKKKHISFGWSFSCFAAHLIERDLF
jgi:hypothetical protein